MADRRTRLDIADGVATITLVRPEKRNALDAQTVAELTQAMQDCAEDETVRLIALRGEGRDFCAGADLDQLARMAATTDPLENLDDAAALGRLFILMRRTEKPIVAIVHGNAIAGGAGLAMAADLILAHENAVFGFPEIGIGFVPAMVTALLRRSIGEKKAFELIATGRRFGAADAHALGLVARVFAANEFDMATHSSLRELVVVSASALRLCKRLLYGIDNLAFEDAIARGAEINVIARATPDCQRGVRMFLDRNR
jgi:methylglutaconyl-CoA hydratase